jgi:DNA/RNA-binding domain of Phe-tRNA-synthetase-like protein
MNNLIVRKIFNSDAKTGFSQVSIASENYKQIVGFNKENNPELKDYTTGASASGQGVRIFDFDGVKVYTSYDKDSKKMLPIMMKTSDAKDHLETLEQSRAKSGDALPFVFNAADTK